MTLVCQCLLCLEAGFTSRLGSLDDHFALALTLRGSPWLLSSVQTVVETEHLTSGVEGLRVVQELEALVTEG